MKVLRVLAGVALLSALVCAYLFGVMFTWNVVFSPITYGEASAIVVLVMLIVGPYLLFRKDNVTINITADDEKRKEAIEEYKKHILESVKEERYATRD